MLIAYLFTILKLPSHVFLLLLRRILLLFFVEHSNKQVLFIYHVYGTPIVNWV
jgi:hypothetical protein